MLKNLSKIANKQGRINFQLNANSFNLYNTLNGQQRRTCSTFFSGTNNIYMEEMYRNWQKDPESVHKSWDVLFKTSQLTDLPLNQIYRSPLSYQGSDLNVSDHIPSSVVDPISVKEYVSVYALIRAFQNHGHLVANLDPLQITSSPLFGSIEETQQILPYQLQLQTYGLNNSHLDKSYALPSYIYIHSDQEKELKLRDIISRLQKAYCASVGIEYKMISDPEAKIWIQKQFEKPSYEKLTKKERLVALSRLARSSLFERYLAKKYSSEKRFGLEGCENMIPMLKTIIDDSSAFGVDSFIMGNAHRGRLNVLANVCRKPLNEIFCRFDSDLQPKDEGSGDVKYHLGMSHQWLNNATGKTINISIIANPSHLEAVNPVVQGKVRAEQHFLNDPTGEKVMSILVHGDASFSGQGVVYETFHLSQLPSYTVHGTVHIVLNNQVGFTTDPRFSRSSRYCTDVSKVVNAPIFHVNADDTDAVIHVAKVASEYRKLFKKDVVIDLVGYRRNGHNEADNPGFTQPLMYRRIEQMTPALEKYFEQLETEGIIKAEDFNDYKNSYENILEDGFKTFKSNREVLNTPWVDSPWPELKSNGDLPIVHKTGVDKQELIELNKKCCELPADFIVHPGIKRIISQRLKMIENNKMDWALGEISAFSTLLKSGVHVRLSGQDVERGTFSHRHHLLHHNLIDKRQYVPLNNLSSEQAFYSVSNSSLSEYAVLGFELGYSLCKPNSLVIWEAQFGDFSNTAQCIIDQFISCGYTKWLRQTGITMLLPHGYDGMGPEHSSARLERFLQMCDEDYDLLEPKTIGNVDFATKQLYDCNWIIANCTTPANIFHILRRQVSMNFRRPLVVMSPKSLLRLEAAKSSFDEISEGTSFSRVIGEPKDSLAEINPEKISRVLFCSGKIYYDLFAERANRKLESDVAIIRIEQLSPFPYDLVEQELSKYKNANIMWVQEEPKNQGSWYFVKPRLEKLNVSGSSIGYSGRAVSATTATGSKKTHVIEQTKLINDSLDL